LETALRLAGFGVTQLPVEAHPALQWAADAMSHGTRYEKFVVIRTLGNWERDLPPILQQGVLALFTNVEPWIRGWVVQCFSHRTGEAAVRNAVVGALGDANHHVAAAAAKALEIIADEPSVREALLSAFRRRDPRTSEAIARALCYIKDDLEVQSELIDCPQPQEYRRLRSKRACGDR